MKVAVLEGVKNLVVKDIPTPIATSDMALVRVKACGICMTDYKAFSGERTNVNFPTICGHEFSGVVEQVGDNVKFFKLNDEIIASPVSNCGICEDCRSGLAQYCKNGAVIGGDGMDTIPSIFTLSTTQTSFLIYESFLVDHFHSLKDTYKIKSLDMKNE